MTEASFELVPVSYSLEGAARATGYSVRVISDAISMGDLVAHTLTGKPGSKKIVDRDDLRAWIKALPVWTPPGVTSP